MNDDDFGFVPDDFGFTPGEPLPGSADIAPGYQEEGGVVHHLPGFSFSVGPGGSEADTTRTGEAYQERLIEKAPSAHDVAPGTQVGPDRRSALEQVAAAVRGGAGAITGVEPASMDSLGRAVRLWREQGERGTPLADRLSDTLSTLLPTANTEEPIIGADRRPQAVWRGLGDAALFGFADELGAALQPGEGGYEARRDELRDELAQSQDQAPGAHMLGELAGSAPLALLPGSQSTALGRIGAAAAQGAGAGALQGAGASTEGTATGVVNDALVNAGAEGALSAGLGVGGEALGALARGAGRRFTEEGLQGLRDRSVHAGLEARGIWGRRPMEAVREFPGGEEAFLERLNEVGAPMDPRRMPDFIEQLLQQEGDRFSAARDAVDVPVDMAGVASDLDQLADAQAPEVSPLTGSENIANALRGRADRAREALLLPMDQAHAQRRELDTQINWNNPDASLAQLTGQRQAMRRSLSRRMGEAADAAGVGDEWRSANRGYGFAAELDDLARGAARRNMQGGIGGAVSRSQGVSNMIRGGQPGGRLAGLVEAVVGPHTGQELRNAIPGMTHRSIERMLPVLRRIGGAGEQFAGVLEQAAARGMGMPGAHFLLMRTRPEYRALIQSAQDEGGESAIGDE